MTKHLAHHLHPIFDAIALSILQLNPTLQQLVHLRKLYTKFEDLDYIVDLYDSVMIMGTRDRRWTYEEIDEALQ